MDNQPSELDLDTILSSKSDTHTYLPTYAQADQLRDHIVKFYEVRDHFLQAMQSNAKSRHLERDIRELSHKAGEHLWQTAGIFEDWSVTSNTPDDPPRELSFEILSDPWREYVCSRGLAQPKIIAHEIRDEASSALAKHLADQAGLDAPCLPHSLVFQVVVSHWLQPQFSFCFDTDFTEELISDPPVNETDRFKRAEIVAKGLADACKTLGSYLALKHNEMKVRLQAFEGYVSKLFGETENYTPPSESDRENDEAFLDAPLRLPDSQPAAVSGFDVSPPDSECPTRAKKAWALHLVGCSEIEDFERLSIKDRHTQLMEHLEYKCNDESVSTFDYEQLLKDLPCEAKTWARYLRDAGLKLYKNAVDHRQVRSAQTRSDM